MKKVLLLTDIPPCNNYTAGLVLSRLVQFLPNAQIAICSIVSSDLNPIIPHEMNKIASLRLTKIREAFPRLWPRKIGKLASFVFELAQGFRARYCLLPKIINFAKEQRVDALWVVLQGQTIVRLAKPLADKMSLPLYTQVWDSFEWWLRDKNTDGYTQRRLLAEFDRILRRSSCCATASWAMSEAYSSKYGIRNIPVIASLPKELARPAATKPHLRNEFIVAIAGQLYAQAEWRALIGALNSVNWYVGSRKIRVRVIGDSFNMYSQSPANFEYLGWQAQDDALQLLSESDLLYLPYWFSEEFRLESTTSFPGKLVSNFAAGRPVFCHAPSYASPAKYIAINEAGYLCDSLEKNVILQKLETAVLDTKTYAKYARNGHKCFMRDFTLERMKEAFYDFLQL